jgi:hypothetical protein
MPKVRIREAFPSFLPHHHHCCCHCYHCLISGFCYKVDENRALLGYYAASCGKSYHYLLCNRPDERGCVIIVIGSGLGDFAKMYYLSSQSF